MPDVLLWLPCTLKFEPISSKMAGRCKPTPEPENLFVYFLHFPSEIFWDLEKDFLVRVAYRLSGRDSNVLL